MLARIIRKPIKDTSLKAATAILLLWAFLFLSGCTGSSTRVLIDDYKQGEYVLLTAEEVQPGTLLYFFAPNCRFCGDQEPLLNEWLAENKEALHKVSLEKIDLSNRDNHELSRKYGIDSVPAFVFINEQGEALSKKIGLQKKEVFNRMVQ
ncbi:thioredoxin family protein [Heliorestis convoluta]|uniref:Thioredoxin n=1 Tax=Heliorestis convoluta TaxID=356322 RepID=A0A5Q2N038_9FIRM|nr:thioredoxin family protein [Heliorestis convoluta]QGG46582.1 thioredoxin [Heliorestis convoluta]